MQNKQTENPHEDCQLLINGLLLMYFFFYDNAHRLNCHV